MRKLTICFSALLSLMACTAFADEKPVPAVNADAKAAAEQKPQPCLKTGSRITRSDGDCNGSPVRIYDREQLQSTGAVDTGQALQMLDPSITIRR